MIRPTLLALAFLVIASSSHAAPPPFAWKDGDRVVLLGDTFIERDQKYGYLETLITAQNPDKSITFRNLGWSGDTARGLSRAGFDKPADGEKRLKEHALALKPTVLIVGYGMAESFDGEPGLARFTSGLNDLLDTFKPLNPRVVLLSPIAHENLGRPLPDPSKHNASLSLYRHAVRKVAEAKSAWFVDLYEPTLSAHDYGIAPLTDDGIHPTPYGYWYFSTVIDMELRAVKREPGWEVRLNPNRPGRVSLAKVSDTDLAPNHARFTVLDATLPAPSDPRGNPDAVVWLGGRRLLSVAGLAPGNYTLSIDDKPIPDTIVDASTWARGFPLTSGPEFAQAETLRNAIVEKNRLYFYRWRPQNETYLFGFRKHEQGNNAVEIPKFDPLIEAQERAIATLRTPLAHVYTLTPEKPAIP